MKLHQKLFLIFIFLLPFQLGYHFWPTWSLVFGIKSDYLAPTIYLTDLLFLVMFFLWILHDKKSLLVSCLKAFKKYAFIFLLASFIIGANIAFSIVWQVSVYKWLKYIEMFMLASYTFHNWGKVKAKIAFPFALSLGYIFLLTLLQFLSQRTIGGLFWLTGERTFSAATPGIALFEFNGQSFLRPYAMFSHPNSLAGYILVTSLITFLFSQNKRLKIFSVILAMFILIVSISQLVWIAALITAAVLLTKRFTKIFTCILCLGILLVSLSLPVVSNQLLANYTFPKTIQERLQLNVLAGNYITSKPLTGVGNGSFVGYKVTSSDKRIDDLAPTRLFQPVHNILLLLVSEVGSLVLLPLIIFLIRVRDKVSQHLILFLPIFLTGIGDHYWLTLQQNMLLLALVFGIVFTKTTSAKIQSIK